ncbi:ABC transporter ATP-binding protein [Geomicrobium sp. JCM 19039]|uniref:ABC transporter ATP-binding protein n=1 Tax=Geomicrobium sp. JCM 19039 TaxID=1460636 RepID=UPI00045F2009|nr:ABC transporter ATP-binding protein [Geomicrobium sp. JCM 19039]GAK14033.1 ABC transporter, ATP-binding protein [Geomicrobium sp. JCM 19039]
MIEMIEATKSYKQTKAVKGLNFHIEKGEAVGLLGPNGAGKTTAISMLASLIQTTTGQVCINGVDVRKNLKKYRARIGVVPQDIALFPELTAEENLNFFAKIHKVSKQESKQTIARLIQDVGLEEKKKEKVETFSGGMKRRLNLACALVHRPEYVFLDEPTVGVDPQSRRHLLDLMKTLQQEQGMAILYTSHYMEEVEFICDRLYVMDRGEVIASGNKEEIKQILGSGSTYEVHVQEGKEKLYELLQQEKQIKNLVKTDDGIIVTSNRNPLFQDLMHVITENHIRVNGVLAKESTLEDVFLHLTGRKLRD